MGNLSVCSVGVARGGAAAGGRGAVVQLDVVVQRRLQRVVRHARRRVGALHALLLLHALRHRPVQHGHRLRLVRPRPAAPPRETLVTSHYRGRFANIP